MMAQAQVQPQTLCLNMIVKDEAHIIRDTLAHLLTVFPITYWVIDDTGSTDGTQNLIREFFATRGISGELFETPWRNFGYNRSQAFAHAHNKTDYVLVWDADDSVVGTLRLPTPLTADSYPLQFGNPGGHRYQRPQIFNNRKRWLFKGVLHEYAACLDADVKHGPLITGDYYCVSGKSGARSKDPEKYKKDAAVLEQGLLEEPDNARYAFYCANSYKDANDKDNAIRMYKRVLTMNGWVEEKYLACLRIYDLAPEPANLHYLVESHRYCPERVEGIRRLVAHYTAAGMNDVALAYYGLVQDYYENRYDPKTVARHLFVSQSDADFFLPYHAIIAAIRTKRFELAATLYDQIFRHRHTTAGTWWNNCLFHNLLLIAPHMKPDLDFLHRLLEFRAALPYKLDETPNKAIAAVIDRHRDLLGAPLEDTPRLMIQDRAQPRVLLTITSCKRLDLFTRTVNSMLRTWTDLDQVDSFLCIDDNSSEEDRAAMKAAFPFFEFYWKTPAERGHRASMNIIWERLRTVQPTYWVHLEDDWLFFRRGSYVRDPIAILERPAAAAANVQQLLYNRNYAELYSDGWGINGGTPLEPSDSTGVLLHQKDVAVTGRNCAYWPHYSFRPSVIRVAPILALGNYDSRNTFFERDYADRWFAAGHRSAFYDDIRCLHIGRLTSERSNSTSQNAYTLNGTEQFSGAATQATKSKTWIVNLERRPDRRTEVSAIMTAADISDYSFFAAVDGKAITTATPELQFLFTGNEYVRRRGVMGCALSHYRLWQQLVAEDATVTSYVIYEDDITLVPDFKTHLQRVSDEFAASGADLVYIGRHKFSAHNMTGTPKVYPLVKNTSAGGTFGYIITKQGAQKLLEYARKNGILKGIDFFLIDQPDSFRQMMVDPPIVLSEWSQPGVRAADSDIQESYDLVDLSNGEWIFFRGVDQLRNDIAKTTDATDIAKLAKRATEDPTCCAFNTLGFLKSDVTFPLVNTPWFRSRDGIFIRKSKVEQHFGTPLVTRSVYVINLARRPDRREKVRATFATVGWYDTSGDYSFYEAIDGQTLAVTPEISHLFAGNDFNSRGGFIGCALSHYRIWQKIANEPEGSRAIVFEDDIEIPDPTTFISRVTAAEKEARDIFFMGYTCWSSEDRFVDRSDSEFDMNLYVGGTFGYIITPAGARKYLSYIKYNGIRHGIDYLLRLIPDMNCNAAHPHIVISEWVQPTTVNSDSDVQRNYNPIDLSGSDWVFYPILDQNGADIHYVGGKTVAELTAIAESTPNCMAFNTLGYFKSKVTMPLTSSRWLGIRDGIFVRRPADA